MTSIKDDTQEIDFCQEFQTILHEKGRLAVRRGVIHSERLIVERICFFGQDR